jgi:hypothetical protein
MLAVPRQLHAGVCTALPRHPVMTLHASFFPSSPLARSRLFALLFVPQCSLRTQGNGLIAVLELHANY